MKKIKYVFLYQANEPIKSITSLLYIICNLMSQAPLLCCGPPRLVPPGMSSHRGGMPIQIGFFTF